MYGEKEKSEGQNSYNKSYIKARTIPLLKVPHELLPQSESDRAEREMRSVRAHRATRCRSREATEAKARSTQTLNV